MNGLRRRGTYTQRNNTIKNGIIAIKKLLPFAVAWMDLEIIMLSEVRQTPMSYSITYGI